MSAFTRLRDKIKNTIIYALRGGPLDGAKTPLALIYLALVKFGVFPSINVDDGISVDELVLIYSAIHAKLKQYEIL